ncbi:MAG: hypothetical protein RIK87_16285 [Fuerstiella sp.]
MQKNAGWKLTALRCKKRKLEAYATFRHDSNFPFDPEPRLPEDH